MFAGTTLCVTTLKAGHDNMEASICLDLSTSRPREGGDPESSSLSVRSEGALVTSCH
jgi:hypothetical protein